MARNDPPSDGHITEVDMQAFADGNLSPERAARVRKYLGAQPGEADRIAFYRQLNMQMQSAFEGVFPQHVHAPLRERVRAFGFRQGVRRVLSRFMGVGVGVFSAVLLILAASGWFAASRVSQEVIDAAAVMALTQASALHETGAAPDAHHDPYAADLMPLGLRLVGTKTRHPGVFARIGEFDYRNADGEPVVLLTAPAPFITDKPHWSAQRLGDVRLLTWTADGKRYVLAGRATAHGLMRAADALTTH